MPKIFTAKSGSVKVHVYSDKESHLVGFYAEGKRVLKRITDREEAKEFARSKAKELDSGKTESSLLNPRELEDFQKATSLLKTADKNGVIGQSLTQIVQQRIELAQILGCGVSIIEIARAHAAKNVVKIEPATMAELVPAFIEHKRNLGLTTAHIDDLEDRLLMASKHFTTAIHELRAEDFATWVHKMKNQHGKPIAAQTKVNLISALSNFFSSPVAKKHLPENWREIEKVERPKVVKKAPDIYTVDQITTLLYAAEGHIKLPTKEALEIDSTLTAPTDKEREQLREIVPFLCLGFFASTRNCHHKGEMSRYDWSMIDMDEGYLQVSEGVAKRNARISEFRDNLKDWLAPYVKDAGPIIPKHIVRTKKLLCELTGIKWKPNGMRKSCLTYERALTGDAGAVADKAGNSARLVKTTYTIPRTRKAGEAWANLCRPKVDNVVKLPTEEKSLTYSEKSV